MRGARLSSRTSGEAVSASLALHPVRRYATAVAVLALVAATLTVSVAQQMVRVVVTAANDRAAADAVLYTGGRVESSIPLVGGVVASVPSDRLAELSARADVVADRTLRVRSASYEGAPDTAFPYEVGATDAWPDTAGEGVGIALRRRRRGSDAGTHDE